LTYGGSQLIGGYRAIKVVSTMGNTTSVLGRINWNGPLVRIDIPNPLLYTRRLPSGLEAGANSYFVRGGYISGGAPEIVIDPVPLKNVKPTPVVKDVP